MWKRLYRTLTDRAVVVPVTHGKISVLISERVGNYQHGAYLGPLFDQMWVR